MEPNVKAPSNATQWRQLGAQAVADMMNGEREHHVVKEVTNQFGKQITLARVQVQHAVERKEKPSVAWLK